MSAMLRRRCCFAGYAFSTYGDTATCWLQDIVLIILIARYRQEPALNNLSAPQPHVSYELGTNKLITSEDKPCPPACLQPCCLTACMLASRQGW